MGGLQPSRRSARVTTAPAGASRPRSQATCGELPACTPVDASPEPRPADRPAQPDTRPGHHERRPPDRSSTSPDPDPPRSSATTGQRPDRERSPPAQPSSTVPATDAEVRAGSHHTAPDTTAPCWSADPTHERPTSSNDQHASTARSHPHPPARTSDTHAPSQPPQIRKCCADPLRPPACACVQSGQIAAAGVKKWVPPFGRAR